jgi:asparagine N-glycosylation enzyme membrane subunit Stt3
MISLTKRPGIVLAGLMAVMVILRIFPGWFYIVRPDREPRLPDPDAYYHFRQASYTLQHFPQLMRSDDMSFYPAVLHNDAAGLYDLTLAGLAKLLALSGLAPMRALWWVCLWLPPLCVTAILPLVYLLVRRWSTVAIGLTAALWYVLLPGSTLSHVTLGVCDHHVVEMLLGVLCILLLQRLVERDGDRALPWWRPAWGPALPLAILQFTWLGAPLFLPLLGMAGLGQLAADVLAGKGAGSVVRAGLRYWLAFLILTGGAGVICPNLIFMADLWRATLAGTGGVLAALAVAGWFFATPRLRLRPGVRLAIGAGALVAGAVLLFAVSSTVRDLLAVGTGHKSTLVAENQEVTWPFYFRVTGLAGILGVLAPVAGVATGAWRRPAWWIAVLPSLFFVAIWCRTYDYVYQGALHAVLLSGYLFGAVATRANAREPGRSARGVASALIACTGAVVLCCWPFKWTMPWWLPRSWYEDGSELPGDGWIEAMRWLRTETPAPPPLGPTPGPVPRGRVGVLTDWSTGQYVNTLAGYPSTASRYPTAEAMAPFFLQSEAAVRLAHLGGSTVAEAVRYVAIEPKVIGDYFGAHLGTIGLKFEDYAGRTTFVDAAFATRLLLEDGNGFAHFRLIFESRQQSFLRLTYDARAKGILPRASLVLSAELHAAAVEDLRRGLWKENGADAYLGHLLAAVKLFEQVEGARIEGQALPGTTVAFELPVQLITSGRRWTYRQSCRADSGGHFQLVVPYSTDRAAGTDLAPASQASLLIEVPPDGSAGSHRSRILTFSIPESAVQHGERVGMGSGTVPP